MCLPACNSAAEEENYKYTDDLHRAGDDDPPASDRRSFEGMVLFGCSPGILSE